jgi:hypothetical protein
MTREPLVLSLIKDLLIEVLWIVGACYIPCLFWDTLFIAGLYPYIPAMPDDQ